MELPARYKELAARCDPLLAQMGMPFEQREPFLAEVIGLVGQILDNFFRELAEPLANTPSYTPLCPQSSSASSTSASQASARSGKATAS